MPFGHLYVFFGGLSIQASCLFIDWVICCFDTELHELFDYFGNQPLVRHTFCNYFLPVCRVFLFVLFLVSFATQKLLSLTRFHSLFLLLFLFPWENWSKKPLLRMVDLRNNLCQRVFLSMFSSRNFMVCLTFRSFKSFSV